MNIRNSKFGLTVVVALALQAFGFQPLAAKSNNYTKISTESQLRDQMIGVPLIGQNTAFQFNSDYSFEGTYDGRPILGTWMWVEAAESFCIEVQAPRSVFLCRSPKFQAGAVTQVRFDRQFGGPGRTYLQNPYPRIWSALEIRQ